MPWRLSLLPARFYYIAQLTLWAVDGRRARHRDDDGRHDLKNRRSTLLHGILLHSVLPYGLSAVQVDENVPPVKSGRYGLEERRRTRNAAQRGGE